MPDRGVAEHVDRRNGLPDAGPAGEDDELAGLESVEESVDIGEPGRYSGLLLRVAGRFDLVKGVLEQVAEEHEPVAGLPDRDRVDGFALVRYRRDGSLDRDFGVGGRVTTDLGDYDVIAALVRQPDGKLLAAGYSATSTSTPEQIALARYLPDGRLDPGFGDGGRVITVLGGFSLANEVALRPDGRFVVAGQTATASGGLDFAVVAYHPDGSLDESFGAGGVVTTDFGTGGDEAHSLVVQTDIGGATIDELAALAWQPDGRLLAAGMVDYPERVEGDFAVARYRIG